MKQLNNTIPTGNNERLKQQLQLIIVCHHIQTARKHIFVIVNWKYKITFDTLGQNKGVHSILKIQGRTIT
jgi:hypothetical protein